MNTETAANPAGEGIVTPAEAGNDAPQAEASTTTDDLDALTKEALGETDASPEFVEVEIDGRKYKVAAGDDQPLDPDLKFGALREADYRKKTMALADERRAFQQEREAFSARANLEGEALARAQDLTALDAEVRRLSQVSVDQLRQAGWTQTQIDEAVTRLKTMAAQRDDLARQVNADVDKLNATHAEQLKAERARAIQQAQLADKALTPERIAQVEAFAVANGVDETDVASLTDPTVFKLLHWADIGKKFIERQSAAAQMKAAGAGKPSNIVGSRGVGTGDPSGMTMEEFIAWRAAGNG